MPISQVLIKHKWPILVIGGALLVGALYVAPQLLIWNKLNDLGKPFVALQLTHHGDEALGNYARFREIYDGHFPPGEVYLDTNAPSLFGFVQFFPLLIAGCIYLFGGSINAAYLFSIFIFPAAIFVLFYLLGEVITGSRSWGLFLGFFGTLTPIFRALPASFAGVGAFFNNIANYFIPLVRTPLATLPLAKTEDPILTYLVLLPAIASLILFWRRPSWKTGAIAGLFAGLLFHTYFHYWVFFTIIVGLMGGLVLLRMKEDRESFRAGLTLAGVMAAVSIPYWINFFMFRGMPSSQEVTLRFGVEPGRSLGFIGGMPSWFDYIFYAFLAVFIYFVFYKRGQRREAALYWIFTAAMFIVWNIQVVTGFIPSPDHWFRAVSPFIFVILFHALYDFGKKLNHRTVITVLIAGSLLLVSKKVVNALIFIDPPSQFVAEQTFNSYAFDPAIVESWDWINKNLSGEPKIISPSFVTSFYLYIQTAARPYLISGSGSTVASNALIEQHFLTAYKLFGVSPNYLKKTLEADYRDMVCADECADSDLHHNLNTAQTVSYIYGGYYVNDPTRFPRSETMYRFISKEKADALEATYPKTAVRWQDTGAEYVYYGPWEKEIAGTNPGKNPDLKLVFKNTEVEIYKILRR